ncbi:hypothetical protein CAOG_03391 [Capsaspora owczarzaki ATCC 30864]|uniref:UDENN domain-containing protein n=1 Tax=Capsaspora owczarzaki (strain ATCC 30864) TaxID=595528 RepID=A0A0D2X2E4_CAPO3|nr:hypothetical protein CAOG_03391 [Capsaspora owczarzaki ATCC 30864]KJE92414.1 hypothetical protein CAOG_003391 [Capsaspora owczarzaki ATCC 30864]|eukprot:XP_004364230.1 hypothetical protein CAOG_03391 [Capsaspora owczarzaki ATCC 30864]
MPVEKLQAVALLEKDTNGDTMWTWVYPALDATWRELLQRKSGLEAASATVELPAFVYGRFADTYFYIVNLVTSPGAPEGETPSPAAPDSSDLPVLPRVTAFSLVLLAKEFHPEKYEAIARLCAAEYTTSKGNTVAVVQAYLNIFTLGRHGDFAEEQYDIRKSYLGASLKNVIQTFGLETILLYAALLLKKRVVVYADTLDTLYDFVRPLPLLVWHRQNWDSLRPYVSVNDSELADLAASGNFVAGFTDENIENHSDLYDVFVNVNTKSVSLAPHAQESLALGKVHKELATFLTQVAADEARSESAVVKAIAVRTGELLTKIRSLTDESGRVTYDSLKALELPPSSINFLWNVALSEAIAHP